MSMFSKILRKNFLLQYRFYSSSLYIPKEIKIPYKIFRDNTSVLKALGNCVQLEPKSVRYSIIDDANLNITNFNLQRINMLSKASGKIIARQAFDEIRHDFIKVAEDEPKIKMLMPLISVDEINKKIKSGKMTPEKALNLMTYLLNPLEAWEFYQSNATYNFSDNSILNLLELLCASGDVENFRVYIPSEELFLVDGNDYEWQRDNPAEILFRSITNKNESHYETMIYGAGKFKNHKRALELFYEMRQNFPNYFPSVKSCNSLIRSLHYKLSKNEAEIIDLIMEIFTGMSHYNISPNVFTFNNAFFAISQNPLESDFPLSLYNEMKHLNIEPTLGTFSVLLKCKFNRKYLFTLIKDIIEILEKRREENIFEELSSEDDGKLFRNMSEIIFHLQSSELNLRLHKLVIQGGNLPLLGNNLDWGKYANGFCQVLIKRESDLDVIFSNLKIWVPYYYQISSFLVEILIGYITTTNSLQFIPDLINLVNWFQSKMSKSDSFYRLIQMILKYVDFSSQVTLKSKIIDSFHKLLETMLMENRLVIQPHVISPLVELLKRIDDDVLLWNYIDYLCHHFYIVPTMINDLMEKFYTRNEINRMFNLLKLFAECVELRFVNEGESVVFDWLKNEKEALQASVDYSNKILPGLLAENNIMLENFEKVMFKLSDTVGRLKEFQISEISRESFVESEDDDVSKGNNNENENEIDARNDENDEK